MIFFPLPLQIYYNKKRRKIQLSKLHIIGKKGMTLSFVYCGLSWTVREDGLFSVDDSNACELLLIQAQDLSTETTLFLRRNS